MNAINTALVTAERVDNRAISDGENVSSIPMQPWGKIKPPKGYSLKSDGVYLEESNQKISGAIWVKAMTQDVTNEMYGLVIEWVDIRGNIQKHAFERGLLSKQGGGLLEYLGNRGLEITPGPDLPIRKYLSAFINDADWLKSVSKVGWIDSYDHSLVYVMPDRVIKNKIHSETIIYQPSSRSKIANAISSKGSIDDWYENVVSYCSGNPYLVFALCLGFSGSILRFTGAETGGFNVYGRSSGGKTTLLQVAASVMGCGGDPSDCPDKSLIQTWNATGNALEGLASGSNDSLLLLDEIGTCEDKNFGNIVYKLAGGQGKHRFDKNSEFKEQQSWRTMLLSTGELSVRQKIMDSGKAVYSGQALRFIDIPANNKIIENTHGMSASELSSKLKQSCTRYYGAAGVQFLELFVRQYNNSFDAVNHIKPLYDKCFKELSSLGKEQEQLRALKKFAHIMTAGILASRTGTLPISEEEIRDSIIKLASAVLREEGNIPFKYNAVNKIRSFLETNRERFQVVTGNYNDDLVPKNCAGYVCNIEGVRGTKYYLIQDGAMDEACGNLNTKDVAVALKDLDLLKSDSDGRLKLRVSVPVEGLKMRKRLYAISSDVLSFDHTDHKTAFDNGTGGTSGTAQ